MVVQSVVVHSQLGAIDVSSPLARQTAVGTPSLEAWLDPDVWEIIASARVAVIGCGRLGRDLVRCLLLTGACTEPRGRMVLIDHGDAALKTPGSSRPKGCSHAGKECKSLFQR